MDLVLLEPMRHPTGDRLSKLRVRRAAGIELLVELDECISKSLPLDRRNICNIPADTITERHARLLSNIVCKASVSQHIQNSSWLWGITSTFLVELSPPFRLRRARKAWL